MQYTPRISIITSVFNGERYLDQCIQSILGQSYPNLEYIIIDGGSSDNSAAIIKKYDQRLHYWVSEKDKGIYHAWNKGLAHAAGEWIAFVGSDDILWDKRGVENATADLYTALQQDIRYVYGKVNLLSAGMDILSTWGTPWERAKKDILQFMTVTHCGAFHHRSLFEQYGPFNERFRITGDYEFLLREFVRGRDAFFSDRLFAGMHAGGISANLRSKLVLAKEYMLARELNGLSPTFHGRMQVFKARVAGVLTTILGEKTIKKLSDLYRVMKGKEKLWSKID